MLVECVTMSVWVLVDGIVVKYTSRWELAGMAKECLNVFVSVMVIHVHAVYLLCVCGGGGGGIFGECWSVHVSVYN